ncbi:hypothetical protein PtA15_5A351 [Puccinia triticina]|uniref:ARID domain-containing protein n=1 Tax=Puccinia triticina TaxID=208348 RepID=A0ABY7CK98_9BASI|nr:uncharacterized protein PtA15_5A351 [Puccinia triticina]WAQ84778.1 hypothetical protein PtA15_5A351 [Puccinia triticina]
MNPNHHGQPPLPPQSLEQEFQMALTLLTQYTQSSPGALNGPLPAGFTTGMSPPQAAQFYPNSQGAASAALNRPTQAQQQAHRPGQQPLPASGSIPPGFSNKMSPEQLRSFLAESAANSSNPHPTGTPFNPSPISMARLPPNQQTSAQHVLSHLSILPAEHNQLSASISAAKVGRLSNDLVEVLFRKLGADLFRKMQLDHLLDAAGNLVLPPSDPQLSQQAQPRPGISDLPPNSMGPAGGLAAQVASAQLSGASAGSYPPPPTSSSGLPPTSITPQPHPSHISSAPHSRIPNRLPHPQSQMHHSKPGEIDETSLSTMRRNLLGMQSFLNQCNYLQRCLSENAILPTDAQPHTRAMSADERTHFEAELLKARHQHRSLNAHLKVLVDKHGGRDTLQHLLKGLSPGIGPGPSTMPTNPTGILPQSQQPRPHSSNAHQASAQPIISLPGHQPHLINQHQPQHPHHLGQAQQQHTELHQTSPHPGPAIQPNHKQVHPQLQQQSQQSLGSHQTAPNSSFPTAVTPQQHARQISQGGGGQIPFSSPMAHPGSTSNTAEHLVRFPNPQQQSLLRAGSPRQGGPGPTQPPRPPSAVQSTGYPSTSPHLAQGSPPNNAGFNPPPTFNLSNSNGITPERLMGAFRDHQERKGVSWKGQPAFRGKELDLCKLLGICISGGGFDRVTAGGFWGPIAARLDNSINQSDNNDMQAAANQLCDLYRNFCLDVEYAVMNSIKRPPSYPVGQPPLQAPNSNPQIPQTSTPHNQPHSHGQFPQGENLGEQRLQQGPMDEQTHHPPQTKPPSQPENTDKELHVPVQHLASNHQGPPHFQFAPQRPNIPPNQPPSVQRDFVPPHGFVPPAAIDNRQPVPHGRPAHLPNSSEAIMALSDEQLREYQLSEEIINKIRLARAQTQNKISSLNPGLPPHLPSQVTQPPPPAGPGAPGWAGPTSATEEGIQIFGPDMPGSIPIHISLTGIPMAKINEASAAIASIRPDCVPHAKTLWSKYRQPMTRELSPMEKEQYKRNMDDISMIAQHVTSRLPEYLATGGRQDQTRQIIALILVFHTALSSLRTHDYYMSQPDMAHMRNSMEAAGNLITTHLTSLSSPPQPTQHVPVPQSYQSSQFPVQSQAQLNDMSNPALAQLVQPPQPIAHCPQFFEHVKKGLTVDDLNMPPSKRARSSTSLVTSPDRFQGVGGPSPSHETSQPGMETSPAQNPNDLASPVGNNPKSPGSKGPGKRNPSAGGATKRPARKPSAQTGRSAKPSHQIMATVKAEIAAAKAREEAEKMEHNQGGKPNTPSAPPHESSGNQPRDAAKSSVPENATPQINAFPLGTLAPATSSVPPTSKPQPEPTQSEKPPHMQVEGLLKELSDSMSSGAQGSTSTNTLDDDGWRGFMADLKLPIAGDDGEGSRPREDELLGSWLFDEPLGISKDSPRLGDGGGFDMMYMGPAMAKFIESHSASEPNGAKGDQSKTEGGAAEKGKSGSQEGLGRTMWKTESMSDFLLDTNQSVFGAQEESSPTATGEGRTANGSNGRLTNGAATETPEFSPSKLSSDSTPESVCSTEGHSGNPKRLMSTHSTCNNTPQVTSKSVGSNDGPCYSNVDEEDALLMYMMGFDDESTIGMPASSANGSENDKKHNGINQFRMREGSGGFTGLDSRSVLSDEFWSRPFVTSTSSREPKESTNTAKADGTATQFLPSAATPVSNPSANDLRALNPQAPSEPASVLDSVVGGVGIPPAENQEAVTVK